MKHKVLNYFSVSLLGLLLISQVSLAQTVYTFTTCGATGKSGPTQSQINTAYGATTLSGQVTGSNGIQTWVVPSSGLYRIKASGAQGGGANGGLGASMEGEFLLSLGQVLHIIVGQEGITESGKPNSVGGGGGSFVVVGPATSTSNILVIAGGGGGSPAATFAGRHGVTGTTGNNGSIDAGVSNPDGLGGSGGSGGNKSVSACSLDRGAGGGGFSTQGGSICQTAGRADGGASFTSGGGGGGHNDTGAEGGFGGGGAVWSTGFRGAGGGGGYSGGGGGQINSASPGHAGGGGGSINNGMNQVNVAGINSGPGEVIITSLTKVFDDAGVESIKGFDTRKCRGTYPVEVVVKNYGANQINPVTVNWEVNGVLQTSTVVNTLLDTANGTGPDTAVVMLGNVLIDTAIEIRAWTSSPNNKTDSTNLNDTMSVSVKEPFYVSEISVLDSVSCNGGNDGFASITGSAGLKPYSYLWSNSQTGSTIGFLTAGQYSCVVTDGVGCKDSATVMVPEPPAINISPSVIPVSSSTIDNGAIILNASGGTPPYSYVWNHGPTSSNLTGLAVGTYTVVIEDGNQCLDTFSIEVATIVGMKDLRNNTQVEIYPNPSTTGQFNLKLNGFNGTVTAEVRNLLGSLVATYTWGKSNVVIDLSGQVKGIYLLRITDGQHEQIQRIVIE